MSKPRAFRESELRQITEIQNLIKSNNLNASINKIKKWVRGQPDFIWPNLLLTISKGLINYSTIHSRFKNANINRKGRYTRTEAADLLNLSIGRIRQLEDEEKLTLMGAKHNRGNRRVFSGAELIRYKKLEK